MIGKLHVVISLIASLAVTVVSLFRDLSFYEVASRLVIVIPVFLIIGIIAKLYVMKTLAPLDIEQEPNIEADAEKDGFDLDVAASAEADEYDDFDDFDDEGMDLEPQYMEGFSIMPQNFEH